jgi:hypothetical protein
MDYWRALTPGYKAALIMGVLGLWIVSCILSTTVAALSIVFVALLTVGIIIFALWFLLAELIKDLS